MSPVNACLALSLHSALQVVEEGGAGKLIALLKAGPNHPVTPHAARALQALACRHPGAQVPAI